MVPYSRGHSSGSSFITSSLILHPLFKSFLPDYGHWVMIGQGRLGSLQFVLSRRLDHDGLFQAALASLGLEWLLQLLSHFIQPTDLSSLDP